jgi:UDP-N-acetylmuramoyl-tripeptide--D-alanyl-D-alanine ligase
MPRFDPELLAQWSGGSWTAKPSAPLTGFGIDTRVLRTGDVFVALRTEKRDGHDFLTAARDAGAAAALVSRVVPGAELPQLVVAADTLPAFQRIAREHRRQFTGPVIGVTGSAGKTSTKNLLALLLGPETLATEGNLNNHLGVPLTLLRLEPSRHQAAVIEAGIGGPGEMAPLADMIEPDVSVVTLIGHAHTEALGGLEGVAREKSRLSAATLASGVAFFPRSVFDHEAFAALKVNRVVVERVERVEEAAMPNTVHFTVAHTADSTTLGILLGSPEPRRFELTRVSDGMAQNAALALIVALWLGRAADELRSRLRQWAPAALRGEVRHAGDHFLYLDCYNANPSSMVDALAVFASLAPANLPRLYVLGGMEELGADSAQLHHDVGRALRLRPQDEAVVIGAQAENLRAGAIAAGAAPEQVQVVSALEPIRDKILSFQGAVFVKGSRKYRLEEAVPGSGAGNGPH